MKRLFLMFALSPILFTSGCGFELVKKADSEGEPKTKPGASNKITITADAAAPQPAPGGGVNPVTEPMSFPNVANPQQSAGSSSASPELGTCRIQADSYAQGVAANPSAVSVSLPKRACADACNEQFIKLKLVSMSGGCLYVCQWNETKLVQPYYNNQMCVVAEAIAF